MMLECLVMAAVRYSQPLSETFGQDVGVRTVLQGGEVLEELYARDETGAMRLVLVSPTHSKVAIGRSGGRLSALSAGSTALFSEAPSFRFTEGKGVKTNGGWIVELLADRPEAKVRKRIFVPEKGNRLQIRLDVDLPGESPRLHYLLDSYAFAPDGKGEKPDSTYCPAIRPGPSNVVGDHYFRAPAVVAQKGALAGMLLPDLDLLAEHRPIPTIVDLDAANGVVDAVLLSYGFCDHRLSGHVYYVTDPSLARAVPNRLTLGMDVLLTARAEPFAAYRQASDFLWERYGRRYFDLVKPQALPFAEYPRVCYKAAFEEKQGDNAMGWFEVEIDGRPCGGVMAGWGYQQGWVSWQGWFNNLRSAWGMRWWGKKLPGAKDWVERADKMLNLALAAPLDRGACPTTYKSREKEWKGCLITPTRDCWYDLSNMAWKGIWLLRWAIDFDDCPRRDEIMRQCREMAECMMRNQNEDGSFPVWLTKDHRPIDVLNHTAQSALPAWFLFELAGQVDGPLRDRLRASALRCADFLMKEVVDQQAYYDFETFFSCSPKPYRMLESSGSLPLVRLAGLGAAIGRPEEDHPTPNGTRPDHEAMRDPHTLQLPQNTLSMQWTAEALRAAHGATGKSEYLDGALKALDTMALYQNVWPISYRTAAYTYGGFGVQNSDGEYHDARQAQFGATLCDFGAQLGRRDLFERGVAAVRASLALVNHPLHDGNGIYPNPNYPLGLMPENCGHGGTDQQNGRTGFDWGEGSGIASMAYLLHKYGGVYVDEASGWAVGIDGVAALDTKGRQITAPLAALPNPWTGRQVVEVRTSTGKTWNFATDPPIAIRRIDLRFDKGKPSLVAIPAWRSLSGEPKFDVRFVVSEQKPRTATVFEPASAQPGTILLATVVPQGFGVELAGIQGARWVWLEGTFDGKPIACEPTRFWIDPTFDFTEPGLPGWKVEGDFAEVPTRSRRYDFNARGKPFIGTCEDGRGGYNDAYMGTIVSPVFIMTGDRIRLLVGGGAGPGVFVELIDVETGNQIYVERGKNRELMDERVWDVSKQKGRPLRIRIVDREQGGWGHINVGQIVCETKR